MEARNNSLLTRGSYLLANYLKNFFDSDDTPNSVIKLLPKEPLFQRQLFIDKAIESGQEVFLQIDPVNADGYTINVHARIKSLGNNRYLASNHNVSYFFNLSQLRYIAA